MNHMTMNGRTREDVFWECVMRANTREKEKKEEHGK